jgi:hypothetical protein
MASVLANGQFVSYDADAVLLAVDESEALYRLSDAATSISSLARRNRMSA